MEGSGNLSLIIVYNASENTYSVTAHNQPPDKTQALVEEFNPHMQPGFTLMKLDQRKLHRGLDAQQCRACRETVQRASGLQPIPKFVRRKRDVEEISNAGPYGSA